MKIATISQLKAGAANLNLEEPLVITQNGIPAYVIERYEDYLLRSRLEASVIRQVKAMAKR
jgi:PHD/YefM family antitoxin component YafN of YafNO toxin-antitoxin module